MTIELPLSRFQQLFLFIVFATKTISLSSHLAHCSFFIPAEKVKKPRFSEVYRGYGNGSLGLNGLKITILLPFMPQPFWRFSLRYLESQNIKIILMIYTFDEV